MARFARSFALASKSGVPITNGLKLVAQTADNDYISRKIGNMEYETIEECIAAQKRVKQGLLMFSEYYYNLWD